MLSCLCPFGSRNMNRDAYLQYTASGFHIARALFAASEIAAMTRHYMAMRAAGTYPGDFAGVPPWNDPGATDPLAQYPRLINMHDWDTQTRIWMTDPRLIEIATVLMGQRPRLIQTMVYFKPPGSRGQSFHQDCLYLRTTPLLGAWVALDRADTENGAMQMVPGSHLLGLLPCREADTSLSFTDSETFFPPDMEKVWILLEPGDTVFFSGYTVHGSSPNRSVDRMRRAFICHYAGEHALPIVGPPLPGTEAR